MALQLPQTTAANKLKQQQIPSNMSQNPGYLAKQNQNEYLTQNLGQMGQYSVDSTQGDGVRPVHVNGQRSKSYKFSEIHQNLELNHQIQSKSTNIGGSQPAKARHTPSGSGVGTHHQNQGINQSISDKYHAKGQYTKQDNLQMADKSSAQGRQAQQIEHQQVQQKKTASPIQLQHHQHAKYQSIQKNSQAQKNMKAHQKEQEMVSILNEQQPRGSQVVGAADQNDAVAVPPPLSVTEFEQKQFFASNGQNQYEKQQSPNIDNSSSQANVTNSGVNTNSNHNNIGDNIQQSNATVITRKRTHVRKQTINIQNPQFIVQIQNCNLQSQQSAPPQTTAAFNLSEAFQSFGPAPSSDGTSCAPAARQGTSQESEGGDQTSSDRVSRLHQA